ncbi:putative bifunctional inhibitor/plant lipid transfer protein/seed storage helical [Arabidopsis thaliana]|uniref:Bifunctional inhibitor/lipid-transfer protein/seed storage 2S albumin superfamily protein n=4 Tax=Arabidopsis TaxID=3701 RepID=Q9FF40_ARATH|nr:Bifunctional inhibitor/lipid-transfer protein/seed storage 2S albumin superfamily protein [Arabidopsis thaliana]KAG7604164.1 Bifunctional inhibitor/plant lipid transfer protein/seed storage helical domain [Arabidopsis thaliana x Arabidopsis arenosa]KAG7611086.1 Bifunctional inhibitor/plant lipid transfer protein/seed storage helical domain [Arabidopsis suecica]AAO64032.1 putative lipid transfer protein [Arabidopsis thaliana]AED94274.1 Bifunctional inhibitor/lipid-transfer protein/seed storag|eukprot:NP_198632.1 Bifunctional inhibitor/lipid-transfer protein/seed storage 2S albumin superfamily protein [Arabidopsis thaliana]
MKFTGVVFILFVLGTMLSPVPVKARVVKGSGEEVNVTCDATQLSSCVTAVSTGAPPSTDCCGKLKEHETCLCTYIQNPLYSSYVTSPNARKTLAACDVAYPTC